MSQFARQLSHFDPRALPAPSLAHWWNDLLSLWRPSGGPAGAHGLRLAIRDGSMNFYRKGQSIARIQFDSKGTPTATTHLKYLGGATNESLGQKYVKLRNYGGINDLKRWIAVVDDKYAGEEKALVDELVAANSNVIDLEMGLPAWGDETSAPRMDLVAIEPSDAGLQVVFWEAKLVADGRIRSSTDMIVDKNPKVLKQLARYRKFFNDETYGAEHVELVSKAYRSAAKLIVQLHEMAGKVHPLGTDIRNAAAASELGVDREPRLVVLNHKNANQAAWAVHAGKLRNAKVAMTVIEHDGPFVLKYTA